MVGGAAHMGAKSAQRSQAAQSSKPRHRGSSPSSSPQAAAAPQQAAPAAPSRRRAEIQKYAALKDQGLITEEDYEAKKKQILGI